MQRYRPWLTLALLLTAFPTPANAEQVRYHYVPIDACGTMTQIPAGPEGTLGELKRGFGAIPLPYPYGVRPTQMVTFRHAFNGKLVTIPLRLPNGPPRIEQQSDRVIYNYANYIVEARFFPDGSVDIIYNSGFLRPLRFD